MKHYEVVQKLEAEPSKTGKEQIVLDAYMNGQFEFFKGASLAYDILVTFGVAKIPGIEADDLNPDDPGTFTFDDFIALTDKLRKRELTGHAARDAIVAAASSCHGPSWNDFYRRVLQKDLRCGATDGTINRVLKKVAKSDKNAEKLMVPVFDCQLAEDGKDPVHQKKIKGRKYLDAKFDGCLSYTWEVEFEDGRKVSIGQVVEEQLEGKIKSYDTMKKKVVFSEITGWSRNGTNDDIDSDNVEWFVITLENNVELPPLTGNHLVYLPNLGCWRRVDKLKDGDNLLEDC